MTDVSEHAAVNQQYWNASAPDWVAMGERAWEATEISWGMWAVPEAGVGILPASLDGLDTIELGCGTGYISSWLARRGANAVGLDISEEQLATARRLSEEHGIELELVHASAENVPFPDERFDLAVSEYGAATWCDPYVWIPEAHRLLRPGGLLIMLGVSSLAEICNPLDGSLPIDNVLHRPYFGMHRFDWTDAVDEPGGIDFNLTVSDWFALFTDTGFAIEAYHELQAPEPGPEVRFFVTDDWAHKWPAEHMWRVRKR